MADIIDNANERADQFLAHSLANVKKYKLPTATGSCLNCQDLLVNDIRWCNEDCREDWLDRNPQYK